MATPTSEDVFIAADMLFEGVDYQGRSNYRKMSGTLLDEHELPLVPVSVEDSISEERSRRITVSLTYLLSDGSRADQSVDYTLNEGDDTPTVKQNIYFGDSWGKDIPHKPFFDEPMPALAIMRKAVDTVRERRSETNPEYRDEVWRLG